MNYDNLEFEINEYGANVCINSYDKHLHKCNNCGLVFVPKKRFRQKFCCDSCRVLFNVNSKKKKKPLKNGGELQAVKPSEKTPVKPYKHEPTERELVQEKLIPMYKELELEKKSLEHRLKELNKLLTIPFPKEYAPKYPNEREAIKDRLGAVSRKIEYMEEISTKLGYINFIECEKRGLPSTP